MVNWREHGFCITQTSCQNSGFLACCVTWGDLLNISEPRLSLPEISYVSGCWGTDAGSTGKTLAC